MDKSLSKKNIIISANSSWYLFNFRKNTITTLISRGYNVIAVSPYDSYTQKLIGLGCDYAELKIRPKSINPLDDFKTLLSYFSIYKNNDCCLVLNFTPKCNIYSTLVASFLNIPVINNISGLGAVFSSKGFIRKISEFLYSFSQKKADVIFFQNKDDLKLLSRKVKFNKKTVIKLIPGSGVDLTRFYPKRQSDYNSGNEMVFLMSSRLILEKGVMQYYEAAKRVKKQYPKVRFLLAGFIDEVSSNGLKKITIEKWEGEGIINYLGCTDHIEEFLSKADCFVLPSYYSEGIPKSLLEAGAMGLPIITTDNTGCREVIRDTISGLICRPRSIDDIFNAFVKLINMPVQERILMGDNARKIIEEGFDEKLVISNYIEALNDVICK